MVVPKTSSEFPCAKVDLNLGLFGPNPIYPHTLTVFKTKHKKDSLHDLFLLIPTLSECRTSVSIRLIYLCLVFSKAGIKQANILIDKCTYTNVCFGLGKGRHTHTHAHNLKCSKSPLKNLHL